METIGRIRREHLLKGKTIKEIARDLKVSRNTVRKVLRSGETSFEYERSVQPRPKLGRWTATLEDLLTSNAAKPAREQLTLIRIFEALRGRGYEGGYDAVRRYAERYRAMQVDALRAALAARGVAEDDVPAEAALLLMTGLSQVMALEGALGVTTGHDATLAFVEGAIARLDGAARRDPA